VNPVERNQTRSAAEFVDAMAKIFVARGEDVIERITHQSFDVSLFLILSFRVSLAQYSLGSTRVLENWGENEIKSEADQ